MTSLNNLFCSMLKSIPSWCDPITRENLETNLNALSVPTLHSFPQSSSYGRLNKRGAIAVIKTQLDKLYHQQSSLSSDRLYVDTCQLTVTMFGLEISQAIMRSFSHTATSVEPHILGLPLFSAHLEDVFKQCHEECLQSLQRALHVVQKESKNRPVFHSKSTYGLGTLQSRTLAILFSKCFQRDFNFLYSLSDDVLIEICISSSYGSFTSHWSRDRLDVVFETMKITGYPQEILHQISLAVENYTSNENINPRVAKTRQRRKELRKDERIVRAAQALEEIQQASPTWPQPVPESTFMSCLSAYRHAINYEPLQICASCGSEDRARTGRSLSLSELPPLETLRVRNEYILDHTPAWRFLYIHSSLDGLLLEPQGIRALDSQCNLIEMYLCRECYQALSKSKMPRLALNNGLYRGELPDELQDVTWAEEMACSLYRTTAHVVRLYGSASETEPLKMHGNTCAHPMNIFQNATSLPWAPTDINEQISVVFIGPRKLKNEDLEKLQTYKVRKPVIMNLLNHLRLHNRLYLGLPPINEYALSQYPDNGILPGLEDRIIYDHDSNPAQMFEEETSSFDEHPAEQLDPHSDVLLEKSGLYDPESTAVPGRFMKSSALQNIVLASDPNAAIRLRYDRDPIPEYNNPNLFAGMFPTLFPLDIGGFEDPT